LADGVVPQAEASASAGHLGASMDVYPRELPALLHDSGIPEQTDVLAVPVEGRPAVDRACRRAGAGPVEVSEAVDALGVNVLARSAESSCAVRAVARSSAAQPDRFASVVG